MKPRAANCCAKALISKSASAVDADPGTLVGLSDVEVSTVFDGVRHAPNGTERATKSSRLSWRMAGGKALS